MNDIRNRSLEELIVTLLQKGALTTHELIAAVAAFRTPTTKQGIYRVLRKLKKEEKVLIYRQKVSLSLTWLRRMSKFYTLAQYYYAKDERTMEGYLNLRNTERVTYEFKDLRSLDSFWSHAFHMLALITDQREPIFVYNPHEWFAYARPENEDILMTVLEEQQRQVFITTIYDQPLDKELKKRFNNDLIQYHIAERPLSPKKNYYINVIGSYCIEVYLDEGIAADLNVFYWRTKVFSQDAAQELSAIIAKPGRNKLVISRNRMKALKIKKMLAKYFYVRKEK